MPDTVLALHQLSVSLGSQKISYPDWAVSKGDVWLLKGQSGTGKTTLLHLIAGLRKPQTGSVSLFGKDLAKLRPHQVDLLRGQKVGLVFQQSHLLAPLTVAENLMAAQHFAGLAKDEHHVRKLLDQLGLEAKYHARPASLSTGEAQRVSIARAVINRPALILADEPTASLDDEHCDAVATLLTSSAAMLNAALIIATHDQRLTHLTEHIRMLHR